MIKEYLMNGGLTHVHTDLSKDGRYSMGQISEFIGRNLRSGYYVVADHLTSPYNDKMYSVEDAGLRVARMLDTVNQCNIDHSTGPLCISGVEVNIKTSGLDIPDTVLEKIDFVIASRHFPWGNENRAVFESNMEQTMRNRYVDVIGHIDKYAPQNVDWECILGIAKDTNTMIEVNFDSPPSQEILRLVKILQLPVTMGADFHTFNGWLKSQEREEGIECAFNLPLSYQAVRQAILVTKQIVAAGIEPSQIVNLRNGTDFINLLKTEKNDRKF